MPISLKSAAGVGGFLRQERLILESGQFVAPFDGAYLVTAIGGGGSGAKWTPTANGSVATGAAAGGLAQKLVRLKKGDVLTLVIGAGGIAPTTSGQNGNAGGTTSVTGPGIALTANGGEGGKTQAAVSGAVAGAVGGTASGGDLNVQGGGSGPASAATVSGCVAATGGGAVGIYGVGHSSGSVSNTATSSQVQCSGGAGVGGKSGDVSGTNAAASKGGSAVSGSADVPSSASAVTPPSNLGSNNAGLQNRLLAPAGAGGGSFPGGGSDGSTNSGAGMFAGSGASPNMSGPPGYGAGSGAAAITVSAGGQGCVVIEWNQEIA